MSLAPAPSASRGAITVQPSYFTSSLYVNPLRDDITHLINIYSEHFVQFQPTQPFTLFKTLWNAIGWTWMHFKIFDSRSRDSFLKVTMRLFLERMVDSESALSRVVALFGLYTFYNTQPHSRAPPLYILEHVEIPIDLYNSLLSLPPTLLNHLTPLQPHAVFILSSLIKSQAFYIIPSSTLHALSPRELPREIFVQDGYEISVDSVQDPAGTDAETKKKKKGRPTKRDKKKKAIMALQQVDKWLEKNTVTLQPTHGTLDSPAPLTAHVLMSNQPTTTLAKYRTQKSLLLEAINPEPASDDSEPTAAQKALEKANVAVLARLKKLDQMAAEKGLEVGGEGGERTGLERVEKAVAELHSNVGESGPRGGILGLLEGGGLANVNADPENSELADLSA